MLSGMIDRCPGCSILHDVIDVRVGGGSRRLRGRAGCASCRALLRQLSRHHRSSLHDDGGRRKHCQVGPDAGLAEYAEKLALDGPETNGQLRSSGQEKTLIDGQYFHARYALRVSPTSSALHDILGV